MHFGSDNVVGANIEILQHLVTVNEGGTDAYGGDAVTTRVIDKFSHLFEKDVVALPVATGTAANVIGLSAMVPSFGAILCHEDAHIHMDECGAPEMYTGGAKLITLSGENAKITPAAIESFLAKGWVGDVHAAQPKVISITQANENGCVYSLEEIQAISDTAKKHGLLLHMDGSRFANALIHLGCSAAEMTWKVGVDVLSFGATKNGALNAEAIIIFDQESQIADEVYFRRKRGGHLFSKMRYLSAQLEAYLENDLWLKNATAANAYAATLAQAIMRNENLSLAFPVEANLIFVHMREDQAQKLWDLGYVFYLNPAKGADVYRIVTAWSSGNDVILDFAKALEEI